jgi:predicted  nucleic acid-binding Zn-ribbon protein
MTQDLLEKIMPQLISPMAVIAIGYIIKSKLGQIDQISALLVKLQAIEEKISELKVKLDSMDKHREEFIVLKSEVKTQWQRFDELKDRVKGIQI